MKSILMAENAIFLQFKKLSSSTEF